MTEIDATSGARRIPRMWFDLYLRTGATPWAIEQDVEVKFNPWHDSANGQFTFRGQGTWMGGGFTGGGGGSFGGGGASGNWGPPATAKEGKSSQRKPPSTFPASTAAQAVAAVSAASEQSHVVVRNGYSYTLDSADRTTVVTGTLTQASDRQRSHSAQAGAGGSDRLATDDGGHYIAARFNGPTDTFNHFAQDTNFNRVVIACWKTSGPRTSKRASKSMSRSRRHMTARQSDPARLPSCILSTTLGRRVRY